MTRQTKTPQQRAKEALGIEQRRLAKLTALRDRLQDELDAVKALHDASLARRNYLLQHPDLQQPTPTTQEKSKP